MTAPLTLTGTPPEVKTAELALYTRARALADRGKIAQAAGLLGGLAGQEAMSATDAQLLVDLLRLVNMDAEADLLSARLGAALDAAIAEPPEDPLATVAAGVVLLNTGRTDAALGLLQIAAEARPDDPGTILPLASALSVLGRPDEARGQLAALVSSRLRTPKQKPTPELVAALGGRLLGYFGHARAGLDFLLDMSDHFDPIPNVMHAAANSLERRNTGDEVDAGVLEHWEKFAKTYDDNLSFIGASGPLVLKRMLARLPIAPDRSRTVLDAGCGTGLNGWQLRPFAGTLYGCDLSVGMLQQARDRDLYDYVVRTDLSYEPTYPDARFDLILLADVLVYIGDLRPVLTALAKRMTPGAWLVLTIEDGTAAAPTLGYAKHTAGRFHHTRDHLTAALSAAGLSKPRFEDDGSMRVENGVPVASLTVAAQKPALAF